MEEAIRIEVATITLWNFAAIIVNVIAFVLLYVNANRNASLKAFFIVELSMVIWLSGKVFKTVSPTEEIRWAFIVFYYFGIIFLAVSFLDFAYIYNKGKPMRRAFRICIYALGVVQFVVVLTNPYHYLFYSRYNFWGDDFGKLFYVHLVINYLFILIGMVLCSLRFNKQLKEKTKLGKLLIIFAILAPLVLNFLYISRVLQSIFNRLNIQVFDITPIVYTWSLAIFLYATFKYEFFDLTPMIKDEVTRNLDTPILITDVHGKALYANKKFEMLFENVAGVVKHLFNAEANTFIWYDKYYRCHQYEVQKMGNAKFIISLHDITSYQMVNNALILENQRLETVNRKLETQIRLLKQTSHLGARNYVARELHDIIGHSLVISMRLLEAGKIFYDKNKTKPIHNLERAKQVIKSGFKEISNVKDKDSRATYNVSILEREIKTMLKTVDVSGIKTNFFLRGSRKNMEEMVFDIIKKVSTELVTNTLKHSGATSLFLSIIFEEDRVVISQMDNGRGFESLKKGNGLSGIDGRLSLVNGIARYTSSAGEGFNANILIPLR